MNIISILLQAILSLFSIIKLLTFTSEYFRGVSHGGGYSKYVKDTSYF